MAHDELLTFSEARVELAARDVPGRVPKPLNFSSCSDVEGSVAADMKPCQCVVLSVGFVVGYLRYVLTIISLYHSLSSLINLTVRSLNLVLLYYGRNLIGSRLF